MTSAATIRTGGAGERWLAATAPIARASRTMALVAGASVLGHLAIVGTVAVSGRPDAAPPTEIAVEIVHEVPKPAPEPAKPAPKPEPAKLAAAKSEAVKPNPDTVKPEPVKSEPAKSEPVKPAPARREVTKLAKARPQTPPKSAPPKSEPPSQPEPKLAREADAARQLAALQKELDSLRAEQAQLQAERTADAEQGLKPKQIALRDSGLGLLPGSFQAVALPSTTNGAGEAATYEAIVFSALAKAKGIGRRQGVPGTAGVRFSVDAAGKLVAVELVTWSGIPDLDTEALALVRRAVFPPPPQGAQRTFVANVNFEVEHPR